MPEEHVDAPRLLEALSGSGGLEALGEALLHLMRCEECFAEFMDAANRAFLDNARR